MPIWLSLLLAAGGTGLQYAQQRKVQKGQQAVMDAAERRSKQRRDAALAAIQQGAEQYDPVKREEVRAEEEAGTASTLTDALQQAAGDRSIGSIAQGTQ